ncbi:MAG: response regulator, partial [Pseudomonadota bacterium]
VDHGIELPADRKSSGKPANGSIVVECRQVAREIVISVTDDGYGLNLEKIQNKAVESNLLEEGQPLNPEDMMIYISQSGFSTADALTEISGRGVGMDVVQTSLRRLSGSVSYDLENPNPGSRFILNLPISLAVSSAMFVQAGDTKFAVPARVIERIIKLETSQLQTLFKRADAVIELSGKTYKLIDLADYLGVNQLDENDPAAVVEDDKRSVILVDSGVQNIAVVVDELLDTKEIVVKNLGDHLGLIPIYAGATIQPNGDVVLVLDLVGISYYESTVALPDRSRRGVRALPLVMVIDDSLTVRKAAERDLTALGIDTVLVRNGLDAMTQIAESKPDMILLDIEMPEMDGFAFLEWLRSESVAKDVPVVMISSRSTGKYIQKANDLGCNAFLSKPYLLDSLIELFNEYLPLETPLESIGDESR